MGIKSKISAFMKKKAGQEITDSTDLSTCIDEDKVDSTVSALMKELKMSPSATEVTIKKGTTVNTLATQLADEMGDDADDAKEDDSDEVNEAKKAEMKKKLA